MSEQDIQREKYVYRDLHFRRSSLQLLRLPLRHDKSISFGYDCKCERI